MVKFTVPTHKYVHAAYLEGEEKEAVEGAKEVGRSRLENRQRSDFKRRYDRLIAEGFESPPPEPTVKKRGRNRANPETCSNAWSVTSWRR